MWQIQLRQSMQSVLGFYTCTRVESVQVLENRLKENLKRLLRIKRETPKSEEILI
jgi:hypothetical protein